MTRSSHQFDYESLWIALEDYRLAKNIGWAQVAIEAGLGADYDFTKLLNQVDPGAKVLERLLAWLDNAPESEFLTKNL